MKRLNSNDLNTLHYRDGGGCLMLFGMPFFIVGCLVLFLTFSGTLKTKGGQAAPMIFGILFGSVFTLVGSILAFGRSGFDFDRRAKTVREWNGLLFPMFTKIHGFSEYSEIRIEREERKNKNSTYYVYQVSMAHANGSKLKLHAPQDSHDARTLAEEIAKFVEFPLVDCSGPEPVRREAAQLDESLRDQAERTGQPVEIGVPPEGMRTTFEASGNAVHFHIPPPPPSILRFAPVGCAAVFGGIFASTFLADLFNTKDSATEKMVLAGVVGFFFLVLPIGATLLGALSHSRRRWDVSADPRELRVIARGLTGARETLIPAAKLEELRLETTKSGDCTIIAISDETRAPFGEGLPEEEARWIIQVIKKAVTA